MFVKLSVCLDNEDFPMPQNKEDIKLCADMLQTHTARTSASWAWALETYIALDVAVVNLCIQLHRRSKKGPSIKPHFLLRAHVANVKFRSMSIPLQMLVVRTLYYHPTLVTVRDFPRLLDDVVLPLDKKTVLHYPGEDLAEDEEEARDQEQFEVIFLDSHSSSDPATVGNGFSSGGWQYVKDHLRIGGYLVYTPRCRLKEIG